MKLLFFLFLFIVVTAYTFVQSSTLQQGNASLQDTTGKPVPCASPLDCSFDLTQPLPGLDSASSITMADSESYARVTGLPAIYHDVSYAAYTGTGANCPLGTNCTHDSGALRYQAFYPTKFKGCSLP